MLLRNVVGVLTEAYVKDQSSHKGYNEDLFLLSSCVVMEFE